MAKKIFILRTNSLVSSENSTLRFDGDNEIVIPFPIIDELEKLTHSYTQKGKIARKLLEYLDSFKMDKLLSEEGVIQKNGSTLRIENGYRDVEIPLDNLNYLDRRCLQIAKGIQEKNKKTSVILVSKNASLRLKAKSIGIKAQNFKDDIFPDLREQYKGRIECETSQKKLDDFYKTGSLDVKDIYKYSNYVWMPNLFLTIRAFDTGNSALARYDGKRIVKLIYSDYHPFGITAQNSGQVMMLEALLQSPSVAPLVVIMGGAGTGKTFQALAVALDRTIEIDSIYNQILIASPIETVGQERIGYLPGNIDEKLGPHLSGVKDNLRYLINGSFKKDDRKEYNPVEDRKNNKEGNPVESGQYFFETGKIQIQPIGFLRGRTIPNSIFIIDETQNIEPDDIKTIVSRAGENSKFVFLGDPTQIDNPNLNERFNGLVYLSEKMKDSPLAWQVTLKDSESVRSELAFLAATKL